MKFFQVLSATIFLIIFFFLPKIVLASDFYTDAQVSYDIDEEGIAHITYDLSIENKDEKYLQKGFDLALSYIEPKDIVAKEGDTEIEYEVKGTETEKHIIVYFEKPVAGVGNKKKLTISFTTDSIAKQSGEIWEIYVPKLLHNENFREYSHELIVPLSFGEEAYLTPKADSVTTTENGIRYEFTKEKLIESGMQATFGKFQVYTLDLSYHIKNSSWKFTTETIALPPDTAVQKMYVENIIPRPTSLKTDEDGNWLATYSLFPNQSLDIQFSGKAIVFANPRRLLAPKIPALLANTESSEYWQVMDPKIKELANNLKTPNRIYSYVVETLSYNYDRATPEVKRLGAIEALNRPDDAICMEFTDLFIAISRAAGIPAREIQGYALSDNPKVQPLSLVSDVLHAWPEYWNSELETWVPVDPTWGDTTGGKDYFTKFDLKHISFAIHGKDDTRPLPAGAYKRDSTGGKDVLVELTSLDENRVPVASVSYKKNITIPFKNDSWTIYIVNEGQSALYNQDIHVALDGVLSNTFVVDTLLPFETKEFVFETPVGFMGKSIPKEIVIQIGEKIQYINQDTSQVILFQLLVMFVTFGIIMVSGFLYLRKRHI